MTRWKASKKDIEHEAHKAHEEESAIRSVIVQ
jgi:hypothetical protein